jgi:hypothetical protein
MSSTKATKKPSHAGAPSASDKKLAASGKPASGLTNKAGVASATNLKAGTSSAPAHHKAGAASAAHGKAGAGPAGLKAGPKPSAKLAPAPDAAPLPPIDGELIKPEAKRDKAPSAVQTLASELIASADAQAVLRHAAALEDERENAANQAARLIQELAETKPELIVPLIERFARLVASKNRRVVATCAAALAPLSRIAPAKVAKQLPVLTHNWEHTTEEGKDGLVRTFAGLCTASVAYQKRLEPALARALGEAEAKLLIRWTEIVLPALKGEPHARARAVVEQRLPAIPRPQAQKIADFLGIKLRPLPR